MQLKCECTLYFHTNSSDTVIMIVLGILFYNAFNILMIHFHLHTRTHTYIHTYIVPGEYRQLCL